MSPKHIVLSLIIANILVGTSLTPMIAMTQTTLTSCSSSQARIETIRDILVANHCDYDSATYFAGEIFKQETSTSTSLSPNEIITYAKKLQSHTTGSSSSTSTMATANISTPLSATAPTQISLDKRFQELPISEIAQVMKILFLREQLFEGFLGEMLGEKTQYDSAEWDIPIIHLYYLENRLFNALQPQTQQCINDLDNIIAQRSIFTFNNYQLFLKTRRELRDVTLGFKETISIVDELLAKLQIFIKQHTQDLEKIIATPHPQNGQNQKPPKKYAGKKSIPGSNTKTVKLSAIIQAIQSVRDAIAKFLFAHTLHRSLEESIFIEVLSQEDAHSVDIAYTQAFIRPLEACANELLATIWHKKHMTIKDHLAAKICSNVPYSSIAQLKGNQLALHLVDTLIYSFTLIKQAWNNQYKINSLSRDCLGSSFVKAYTKVRTIKNLYASTYNMLAQIHQKVTSKLPILTEDAQQPLPRNIFIMHTYLTASQNLDALRTLNNIYMFYLSFRRFHVRINGMNGISDYTNEIIIPSPDDIEKINMAYQKLCKLLTTNSDFKPLLCLQQWEFFNHLPNNFVCSNPSFLSQPGEVSYIHRNGVSIAFPVFRLFSLIEYYAHLVTLRLQKLQQQQEQDQQSSSSVSHDYPVCYPKDSTKVKYKKINTAKRQLKQSSQKAQQHNPPPKKQITDKESTINATNTSSTTISTNAMPIVSSTTPVAPQKEKIDNNNNNNESDTYHDTSDEPAEHEDQQIVSAINNLYTYFNYDDIVVKDDNYVIIKQSLNPYEFTNDSMTVIIHRTLITQSKQPFSLDPITQKITGPSYKQDKYHKISTQIKDFLDFGYHVTKNTITTIPGIHQNFETQLSLADNQYALIIPATLVLNNRFIAYKLANNPQLMQSYQTIAERGRCLGAYVFIVDTQTNTCFHACFHETKQSRLANRS